MLLTYTEMKFIIFLISNNCKILVFGMITKAVIYVNVVQRGDYKVWV